MVSLYDPGSTGKTPQHVRQFRVHLDIPVIYLGKNKKGQHQLSRKKLLEERGVKPRGDGYGGGGGGRRMENNKPSAPAPEMSKEEIDVIAKAIDNTGLK